MKGKWAIPVIASILILGSLGLIQEADAVTFTATQSGDWDNAATWVGGVPPLLTTSVAVGVEVDIPFDIIVTIPPGVTIHNLGAEITIFTTATLNNFGTINILGGTITSAGTINNFGTIINDEGTIVNDGGTINLVDGGSITFVGFSATINNFIGATIVGGSCGSGTTVNESTNECEADVTQADLNLLQIIIDGLNTLILELQERISQLEEALLGPGNNEYSPDQCTKFQEIAEAQAAKGKNPGPALRSQLVACGLL